MSRDEKPQRPVTGRTSAVTPQVAVTPVTTRDGRNARTGGVARDERDASAASLLPPPASGSHNQVATGGQGDGLPPAPSPTSRRHAPGTPSGERPPGNPSVGPGTPPTTTDAPRPALGPATPWRSRCSAPECERKHYGRGLCRNHYDAARWAFPDRQARHAEARRRCREGKSDR